MTLVTLLTMAALQPPAMPRWLPFDELEGRGAVVYDSQGIRRDGGRLRVPISYRQYNGDAVGELVELECARQRSRTLATVIVLEGQRRVLRSPAAMAPIEAGSLHSALAARVCPAAPGRGE